MIKFELIRTRFDDNYIPNLNSRRTTNLVNLSRNPTSRKNNINTLFDMINKRLNSYLLLPVNEERYKIKIDILTTQAWFDGFDVERFPISEMLDVSIVDTQTQNVIDGPIGLNLSSYLRDYDFNVVLPKIIKKEATQEEEESFGLLHGIIYQMQFKDFYENGIFDKKAVMAISVSSNRTYTRTNKIHSVLGINYAENGDNSYTANYLKKMGFESSYYMAQDMSSPLAFYHVKDDLENRDSIQLWALISVMDVIQKIYRPEIYGSNKIAGEVFNPSLTESDYTRPAIYYDREERDDTLVYQQADYVNSNFLNPYKSVLKKLISDYR
jgi:hypothetical protein